MGRIEKFVNRVEIHKCGRAGVVIGEHRCLRGFDNILCMYSSIELNFLPNPSQSNQSGYLNILTLNSVCCWIYGLHASLSLKNQHRSMVGRNIF